jgi:hypothetical protein
VAPSSGDASEVNNGPAGRRAAPRCGGPSCATQRAGEGVSRAALSCHVSGNRALGRDGLPVKKSGRRRGKLEQNVLVFFAPTRYRVVKITRSCSEVIL